MNDLNQCIGEDEERCDDERLWYQKLKISLIDCHNYPSTKTGKIKDILDDDKTSEEDSKEEILEASVSLGVRSSTHAHTGYF